jgi:uncharacterized protein YbaR (Trm112 family)
MKLDPVLLEILVCPDCKGSLTVDNDHDELICDDCGLSYPVRDDIPVMLVDEARRPGSPRPAPGGGQTSQDAPVRPIEVPPGPGSSKPNGSAQGSDG